MPIENDLRDRCEKNGYERCIVSFIEILGFRRSIKIEHSSKVLKALTALRKFTRGDGNDEAPPTRMDEVRLYSQAYSESVAHAVVRVRTIDTQSEDGPFLYELYNLAMAQAECVNQGLLIRGGTTIGCVHVGLDGQGPIFGDGMVRAYEMQRDEAKYPRLLIDDMAIESFLSDPSLWQLGQFDENDAEMARNLIKQAEDGSFFVDYLRAMEVGEFDDGELGRLRFLERHKNVVVTELNRADDKTRRELIWVARYHNDFVGELRSQFEGGSSGAFEALVGTAPVAYFDSLLIKGAWSTFISDLADLTRAVG